MHSAVKKRFPLITSAFWISLGALVLGAALMPAVIYGARSTEEHFVGLLTAILVFLIGTAGIPATIVNQMMKRRSVFHVDDENRDGKIILYRSEYKNCSKRGLIAATVYLNDSILNRLVSKINLLRMIDKVYVSKLPDICTVNFVPDNTMNRGKTDIYAITDGHEVKVETKESNEWTANLVEHELIHIILLANKSDVNHHAVTRSLGV